MDLEAVRQIVRRRLVSGELPQDSITRFWGGRARGEECDACGERIGPTQIIIEAVSTQTSQGIQFTSDVFTSGTRSAIPPVGWITLRTRMLRP